MHLDKILQFNFVVKVGIRWNVMLWTAIVAVRQLWTHSQSSLLIAREPTQTYLNAFDHSDFTSFSEDEANVSILKHAAFVFPDHVN